MKGERIGAFRNDWRGRHVTIFEDTDDPAKVYTEGRLIVAHTCDQPGFTVRVSRVPSTEPICTHEPREDYKAYIGTYNKVYR